MEFLGSFTAWGTLPRNGLVCLVVGRFGEQYVIQDGVELDERPCCGVGLGLGLSGLVNEEGRTRVEDLMRGCVILFGPGGQGVPKTDAPGVVALNDQRCVLPPGRALQRCQDSAHLAVGERQVVEVGAVAALCVVVVDTAPDVGAVRNGEMQKDEVGLIGVQQLKGVLFHIDVALVMLLHIVGAEIVVSFRRREGAESQLLER